MDYCTDSVLKLWVVVLRPVRRGWRNIWYPGSGVSEIESWWGRRWRKDRRDVRYPSSWVS